MSEADGPGRDLTDGLGIQPLAAEGARNLGTSHLMTRGDTPASYRGMRCGSDVAPSCIRGVSIARVMHSVDDPKEKRS